MKRNAALLAVWLLAPGLSDAGQFGTGFAISPKGYLVTCHHVVGDADRVIVHTGGGYLDAAIVALDPQNDLAVLKVEAWPGRHLGLVSSSEITHASPVIAAGFPDPSVLGINPKISTGIVNALSGVRDDPRFIQISAPVQPGNSGGPLISASGRVVGVVAAGLNSIDRMENGGYLPQSVNYAIKADLILPLLKSISVSVPRFGTRTGPGPKQIDRTLGAIALIEGLKHGEPMYVASRPYPVPDHGTAAAKLPFLSLTSKSSTPRGPWVFPESHLRPLGVNEVSRLSPEGLWRARNEILLRHGFIFPDDPGRRFAAEFGPLYRPVTPSFDLVWQHLNPAEVANLRLIADFEGAGQSQMAAPRL
ncbi:MAG: trypsin-like peptidase domain-containing protein [Verrucomicrobiae bacterium]|nr:trypsin-like peptidase domain-containing protein [Verrucomicrobiae bacterium]